MTPIDWTVRQTICGIDELPRHEAAGVTHLLSILDPGAPEIAAFDSYPPHERLGLRFDDIIAPMPGLDAPEAHHVEQLLAFGRRLPTATPAHLLVHCHAGVSRSTAAMAALLLQARPGADEDAVLDHIARARPQAWPNSRMIGFADALLARGGRLVDALGRYYGRRLSTNPSLADPLRTSGRGAEVDMAT